MIEKPRHANSHECGLRAPEYQDAQHVQHEPETFRGLDEQHLWPVTARRQARGAAHDAGVP